MLQIEYCRKRQSRLLELLRDRKLDAILVGLRHHAYYFSAHFPFWQHEGAFLLFADGESNLIAANCIPGRAAADEILPFEAHYSYTLRQEQPRIVAETASNALKKRSVKTLGVDTSQVTAQRVLSGDFSCVPIDEDLWQLRRRKDPDELELMETAIRCSLAMHARAREIVRPGISEVEVFGELHTAAVEAAGEPLTALLGNDYQCGTMGGPPRGGHIAQPGEIYILDVGPAYRGYFADNTRSISVDGNPSPGQTKVWEAIAESFRILEAMAKPGARCRDLHRTLMDYLQDSTGLKLVHHLGHGVGLQPHEYPHLNPKWDDVLMEGEIFTYEPGLYSPELAGGMRIENQYLVTSEGVINLVDIPIGLTFT